MPLFTNRRCCRPSPLKIERIAQLWLIVEAKVFCQMNSHVENRSARRLLDW